jgi:hypothetical protein
MRARADEEAETERGALTAEPESRSEEADEDEGENGEK